MLKGFYRYLFVLSVLVACGASLHAQTENKHSLSVGWGIAIPSGTGNFLNKSLGISPSLGWSYRLSPLFSAGLTTVYGYAKEEGKTRDRYEGGIVDGFSSRSSSAIAGLVDVRYFPLGITSSVFRPYVGLSAGVQYAHFDIIGEVINKTIKKNSAGVFQPGIGLIVKTASRIFFQMDGAWKWSGNGMSVMDTSSQQTIEIRIGTGITF